MGRPKKVAPEKIEEQAEESHGIVKECVQASFVDVLETMVARTRAASDGVQNRELSLALGDIVKHLDSAIGYAKFAEEAIKVNKLDVSL